jgi:hypothetical protein
MDAFETAVRENGFTDVAEFNRMVANVDLSTGQNLAAFEAWKKVDGTKEGLLRLPVIENEAFVEFATFMKKMEGKKIGSTTIKKFRTVADTAIRYGIRPEKTYLLHIDIVDAKGKKTEEVEFEIIQYQYHG